MAKNKKKALFFWAAWDCDFYKKLNDFVNEAKKLKFAFETIDVETQNGVSLSIKYGIRNVPAIVVVCDNKVVGIERGNDAYTKLVNYL